MSTNIYRLPDGSEITFANKPGLNTFLKAHDDLNDVLDGRIDELNKLQNPNYRVCCINCDHFEIGRDICQIAKRTPPAKVITLGCEKFEDNLPF